jgi:hypothetical protein
MRPKKTLWLIMLAVATTGGGLLACAGSAKEESSRSSEQPFCAALAKEQGQGYAVYDAETNTEYVYVVDDSAPPLTPLGATEPDAGSPSSSSLQPIDVFQIAHASDSAAAVLRPLAEPDICHEPLVGRGDSNRRVKVTIRVASVDDMKKLLASASPKKSYARNESKAAFFPEHPKTRCSRESGIIVKPDGAKSDAIASTTDHMGTSATKDDLTWYERVTWTDPNTVVITISDNHPEKVLVQNEGRPDSDRVVTGKRDGGVDEKRSFRCVACHDKPDLQDKAFQDSIK